MVIATFQLTNQRVDVSGRLIARELRISVRLTW